MNNEASGLILEKIDSIERRLLELESKADGSIDPQTAVHLLFRDLHNLKSSLSMQGADMSAKLIHQAESCLDALRSGKGDIESDWIDLLLVVADQVRKAIEAQEETEEHELSQKLDTLLSKWLHQEQAQTREIGFPLTAEEAQAVQKTVSSGLVLYTLEKLVGEDLDASVIETLPVFETVTEIGTLIAQRLVRVIGSGSVLTILFATAIKRDDLSYIIFDPFYPVTGTIGKVSEKTATPSRKQDSIPISLKRILIVDDEPIALMLLQNFLSSYGRIDTAQNGNEALDKFSQAMKGKDPYHIIFLDILIPGITGNTVLEEIRKGEDTTGVIMGQGARIVMASSISDYSSISASFQNQGDAYLVKPIDAQIIDKTMDKLGFKKIVFPFMEVPNASNPQ